MLMHGSVQGKWVQKRRKAMDLIVWKKKKRREERVNRGNGERKSREEEEEDEWVREKREMKHKNKSNNDVACFH